MFSFLKLNLKNFIANLVERSHEKRATHKAMARKSEQVIFEDNFMVGRFNRVRVNNHLCNKVVDIKKRELIY